MATAGNITAVLTLNASRFNSGLKSANTALDTFKESMVSFDTSSRSIGKGIDTLSRQLQDLKTKLDGLALDSSSFKNFNNIALGVKRVSEGLIELGRSSMNAETGINIINSIFQAFSGALNNVEVKVKGVSSSMNQMGSSARSNASSITQMATATTQYSIGATNVRRSTDQLTASLMRNSEAMRLNGAEQLRNMGYTGRLSIEEEKASVSSQRLATTQQQVANSSRQSGSAMNTMSSSAQRSSASMNQMASTSTKLGQALYSLMRVGRLVAIMFGYQIAYQFLHATTETVNARSEMENYARMLNWSSGEVDNFNKSLDETVNQFQRVNKYSLGETTMSIGVEFDLTPSQMAKANPIIAMITSEYMRAGRTPAEASLAVKDILQGEFTRLSRETGVGEEELINAGWSGDIKDIDGLLSALEKVGTSRHWDQFAEKAHSLNDAITILQNRFGEWSADMVNAVQPAIVNAFNSIMSFAGGLSEGLGNIWQWLSGDSWTALATKIGVVTTAVYGVATSLTMWRTGASLLELRNAGLLRTIMSLITGIKLEEMANLKVSESITAKLLGLKAEEVAEKGLVGAINSSLVAKKLSTLEENTNTASRTTNTASIMSQMMGVTSETDAEELNALAKQLNTGATVEGTGATIGFTGALMGMITGEGLAEGATLTLTGALGALTGAFLASPIGWFAVAILGLASAFFVLTGGLDDSWDKMKRFNEIMENAGEEQKKADQYLKDLGDRVGYTSQQYKDASESVDNWKQSLQSASLQMEKTQKDFDNLDLSMSTSSKPILRKYGLTPDEIEKFDGGLSSLVLGKDKYYKADQVLNKQILDEDSNFVKDLDKYVGQADKLGWDKGESADKLSKLYYNKAEHSYIANTTDDWWEWMWNDLYAGMDDMWIQWEMWYADLMTGFEEHGLFGGLWDAIVENLFTWKPSDFKTLGLEGVAEEVFSWFDPINWGNWGDPVGSLTDWFNDTWNAITKDLIGGFGDAWANIDWGNWGDPIGSLTDFLNDTCRAISDAFWGIMESIGQGVLDLGNFIKDSISTGLGLDNWGELTNIFDPLIQGLTDAWNNFISFEWLGGDDSGSNQSTSKTIDLSKILGVSEWIPNLANSLSDIPSQLPVLFDTYIVQPILEFINGYVDVGSLDLGGLLNIQNWIPNLETQLINLPATLLTLFDTYIIQPISNALSQGLMSIPFVNDIMEMLGLLDIAQPTANEKGMNLGQAIARALENVVRNIPILSDILSVIGQISGAFSEGYSKGNTLGEKVYNGIKSALSKVGQMIYNELLNALGQIGNLVGEAWNKAVEFGNSIVNGIKSALHINSPGIIHDMIVAEFSGYVPQAIDESGATAFASAQQYGQQVVDGVGSMYANMPQVAMDFFTNGALSEYQTDANTVTTLSSDLSLTTVDAFNTMQSGVNTSVTGMASDVSTQYMAMQQNQNTMMTNMQNANLTGYRQMNLQTNQQLLSMRNETQQVTTQMIGAWSHMKTQLVATANALRNESSAHFNSLSSTIGSFYRKIQNPANWGAGHGSGNVRTARNPTVGKSFAKGIKTRSGSAKHYAGGDYYTGRQTMTLRTLKNLMCPNGDCGTIFDGMDLNKTVDVNEFLASVGLGHGFGTWGSWNGTHYNYIKNKSDQWNMKSPQLLGRINTNADFKVGDFENGTPKISFGSFQSMAESLFSAIPYKFYYDSSWKGSWLGAIQAGACNCYDGASALIAFANTCGFSGTMAHGTWNGIPHVWAVIEGRKMDTTGWQQRGTWTPSASAGGLSSRRYAGGESKTYNITIDMKNSNFYGEDDFENRIRESAQKVMREEFNDPYTIPI